MAILPMRIWGDPVLTKRAQAVDKITAEERRLIADMIETMQAVDGAGLAAPQVGVSKRIFVFRRGDDVHAIINPRILRREGGLKIDSEGCLSIPGVQAKVARYRRVILNGRDEKGRTITLECEDGDEQGRAGTCAQHELDHLDGILYVDKAEPDSLVWLFDEVDEDGEEYIATQKTTIEQIKATYKSRKLPHDLHVPDMLRERVEK